MKKKYSLTVFRFFIILFSAVIMVNTINAQIKNSQISAIQTKTSYSKLPHFTEIAKLVGVDNSGHGRSASWVDYNEDGWPDIFVCNGYNQCNVLYKNLGNGTFEDIIQSTGLVSFLYTSWSRWIDLDNDGFLDLFLANVQKNQLFKNTGKDSFVNISNSLNLRGHISWADFNCDGWLDYYASCSDANQRLAGSPPNLLYKNLYNNRFEEIADSAGVLGAGDGEICDWIDYNNDGYLDIYVVNGNQQPNHLFQSNGNKTFTDVMNATGIFEHDSRALWADFNNDGWVDLFTSDPKKSNLYKNNCDGTFANITLPGGLSLPGNDGTWIDFDNDGFLDFFWITGSDKTYQNIILLYHNNQDETFTNVIQQTGLPDFLRNHITAAWGDYDNDGDQDCYLVKAGHNRLYRNEGNGNNWLQIQLEASVSNRDAIGAGVKVVSGTLIQFRDVGVGMGFTSLSRQTLHFGLGQAGIVDSICIQWPSGIVQDTFQVAVNQKILLQEPIPPLFSNVTRQAGIGEEEKKSYGAAFIDYDNDSFLDIFVCNHQASSCLFLNRGNALFFEKAQSAGSDYGNHISGIGYGDFNNDGLGDIYFVNAVYTANILLKNKGAQTFLDITAYAGVAGEAICSEDLVLGDFNNDNYLDIFVGNNGANALYFNQGDFKFREVTEQAGIHDTLFSHCTAGDYDNDGDLDIYLANNRGGDADYPIKDGWPNRLYRNNGDGTFTDVAYVAGVQDSGNSKGCCFGDYDNDGELDLYVGNDGGPNSLFRNNHDGTFTDVTDLAGVAEPMGTHSVVFADFNNDGNLDIYAAGGSYIPEQAGYCSRKDHPDKLYLNNGDGTFTDITGISGIEFNKALTAGITVGDYDNDGDLDVFLANNLYKGSVEIRNVLLQNNGNHHHWLHLKLVGHISNRSAIGARVQVTAGELVQIREVSGGIGGGSQNSLPVEFGLGYRDTVDLVTIRWPSGIIQMLENVAVDQLLVIEESFQWAWSPLTATLFNFFKIRFFVPTVIMLCLVVIGLGFIPVLKKYNSKRKVNRLAALAVTRSLEAFQQDKNRVDILEPVPPELQPGLMAVQCLLIKINLTRFRGEYLLTYSLEPDQNGAKLFEPFHQAKAGQEPYPIKQVKINRLRQKIELLRASYTQYLISREKQDSETPIDILHELGERIYHNFGLTGLLENLFAIEVNHNLHLNFIVNNPSIPWCWAFNPIKNQFLFEKFPFSVSFATEKKRFSFSESKMREKTEPTNSSCAILFYGDWKGHPKELKLVKDEIREIGRLLTQQASRVNKIYQDCDQFAETIRQMNAGNENLRLIHYSGHIEQNILELGEGEFFSVNFIRQAYGITLPSQPVVFLNGCHSGEFNNFWQKHDNLATEFLDCGASACIVTHNQIPEITAKNFALRFYHYFIKQQLTVGQALQQARLDLGKIKNNYFHPDYDLTRYFYNLYGDPTVRF
ncbi:MAG: FG-GAP-like repeat-containing protein [Methanosarcinaceae archaeon]